MDNARKNERKGFMISIAGHVALLLAFFFLLAYRAPDPPIPEYGIVVNFGDSDTGMGEQQPVQRPQPRQEPVEETEEAAPEEVEEVVEEPVETVSEPVEETVEEVVDETPVEAVTQPEPNPVTQMKEVKKKTEEKPRPATQMKEVKKEPAPTPNPATTMSGSGNNSSNPSSGSQGNTNNPTGDQGDPQGQLDSKALYGSQGGGGGSMLDLAGWRWDSPPRPQDRSSETGRIIFEIKVDDRGEIISVRTIEKTVSPAVERIYKREVENLTFSVISANTRPAPVSTGRITFILKAN